MPYKRKEIFGNNTIYLGNSVNILPTISNVDCVFIDVPYLLTSGGVSTSSNYGSKNKWLKSGNDIELLKKGMLFKHNDISPQEYLPLIYDSMEDKAHIYLMTNNRHLADIEIEMRKCGFNMNNILVMRKNNCVTSRWYMKDIEFTLFARKGGEKPLNSHSLKSCINVIMPNGIDRTHETEKPSDYIAQLITNSTQENDIVLDCFMGSGSTGVACIKHNRGFIGMEIDETHFDTACFNMENELKQLKLF